MRLPAVLLTALALFASAGRFAVAEPPAAPAKESEAKKPAAASPAPEACCEMCEAAPSLATLVPAEAVAFAEFRNVGGLIRKFPESAAWKLYLASPAYKLADENKDLKRLREGLANFEKATGLTTPEALDALVGGGMAVAAKAAAPGKEAESLVLLRGSDPAKMRKVLSGIVGMVPGGAWFIRVPAVGDEAVYQFGAASYFMRGDLLAVSNNRPMIEAAARLAGCKPKDAENAKDAKDAASAAATASLDKSERFAAVAKARPAEAIVWGWLDLSASAKAAGKERLLPERHDNIVGAMLGAGGVEAAEKAGCVTAELVAVESGLRLTLSAPVALDKLPPTVAGLLPAGPAATPDNGPAFPAGRTIGHWTLNRDLASLWANRQSLVRNEEFAGLAQLDNFLTSAFGGKDFGQEVLPQLAPDIQIQVLRQDFASADPATVPAIKLPGFAIVLHTRKADDSRNFLRAFKRLIGVISYILGEQSKGDIDLDREAHRGNNIWYLEFDDAPDAKAASMIKGNFSPSVVALGDRFVITSTKALAREFVDLHLDGKAATGGKTEAKTKAADVMELNAAELGRILAENREALIANAIAEKGHTRERAEAEVSAVLGLVELFRSARISLTTDGGAVRWSAEVRHAAVPAAPAAK
jgi:hypothetical protein